MFGFFRNKKVAPKTGCCQGKCQEPTKQTPENLAKAVIVLGSGCKKCHDLEKQVTLALAELGLQEPVYHVTDFEKIAAYGVMTTPALVIDQQVVSQGKVLTIKEAKEIIKNYR